MSGTVSFSSDVTANSSVLKDSDRLTNDRHFLGCAVLKDLPKKRGFDDELIKPF